VAELLDRARLLVAAGPHAASTSEVTAVHAMLYPSRDAVCQTCPGELGRAYYAIQRWVTQQENSTSTSISSNVKNGTTARFHSDSLIYTPHGLGIAYSNDNLTDKAARDILAADPDAAQHFSTLPPEESDEEKQEVLTASQQATEKQVEQAGQQAQAPAPSTSLPAGFDYAQLASAMMDEVERRQREAQAKHIEQFETNLKAQAGGATDGEPEVKKEVLANGVVATTGTTEPAGEEDGKPVRLSRMNKDQLVDAYRHELGMEPLADLTNDELRTAIAEKRASQQDPE
jgi:hypothetical protein